MQICFWKNISGELRDAKDYSIHFEGKEKLMNGDINVYEEMRNFASKKQPRFNDVTRKSRKESTSPVNLLKITME